jgi:hypothetical protein
MPSTQPKLKIGILLTCIRIYNEGNLPAASRRIASNNESYKWSGNNRNWDDGCLFLRWGSAIHNAFVRCKAPSMGQFCLDFKTVFWSCDRHLKFGVNFPIYWFWLKRRRFPAIFEIYHRALSNFQSSKNFIKNYFIKSAGKVIFSLRMCKNLIMKISTWEILSPLRSFSNSWRSLDMVFVDSEQ